MLKQGEMTPGERFEVPAAAALPVLTTGKPEALRISVGTSEAPSIGPAGKTVSGVSLKAADLMRTPAENASTTTASPAAGEVGQSPRRAPRQSAPAAPAATTGSASPAGETNAASAPTTQ